MPPKEGGRGIPAYVAACTLLLACVLSIVNRFGDSVRGLACELQSKQKDAQERIQRIEETIGAHSRRMDDLDVMLRTLREWSAEAHPLRNDANAVDEATADETGPKDHGSAK